MDTYQLDILAVDDDTVTRTVLADGLGVDGHKVSTARSCREAHRMLRDRRFDLVLLDLNLPDASGYALLREIRAGGPGRTVASDLPVIVLSGRGTEVDRLRGFELGCDDYLVKPYSFAELRGRIAAVARRGRAALGDVITVGDLTIDVRAQEVRIGGRRLALTGKEYGLLVELARDPYRVLTKRELLARVWGHGDAGSSRTLDSHACRLRRKLDGGGRRYVVNVWGTGYRLLDGAEPLEVES
jgi:DNA-binding response OmpR family regulator